MTSVVAQWMADRKLPVAASIACAVLCVVLVQSIFMSASTGTLRMSAGPSHTRRHVVAEYLARQAAANRLPIQIVESAGTEDSLRQIKAGQLDVALVSNSLLIPDDKDITVVGALPLEAVHVLVRPELADSRPLAPALRGKRVNIGVRGSTEWLLAREFLQFASLRLPSASGSGDVVLCEFSKQELLNKSQAILQSTDPDVKARLIAELPECIICLATLPSTVAIALMDAADYRLVPLPATPAFLLDNLQERSSAHAVLERDFLEHMTIPAHSYYVRQCLPESDCETVGVRLLVVAHRNTPAAAIRPLMQTLFEGEFCRRIGSKSPREVPTPYALHPAAVAYLDRDKPLIVRDLIESFSTLLSIFGAFSAGALSLYGLLWRRKIRKPVDYYAEIRKLQLLANGMPAEGTHPLPPHELVRHLDNRLVQLRLELVTDVCEGRLEGDQVVANILGLLSDLRQNQPLHIRETAPPLARGTIPVRRAA